MFSTPLVCSEKTPETVVLFNFVKSNTPNKDWNIFVSNVNLED